MIHEMDAGRTDGPGKRAVNTDRQLVSKRVPFQNGDDIETGLGGQDIAGRN